MKASIEWMNDYVPVEGTTEELQQLADQLTQGGIPVEEVYSMNKGIKKVYTGEITAIEPHPDADRLVVCKLSCLDSEGKPVEKQIVTGATNVKVGQIVPVAYHKSKLPEKSISKGKLRGVMSEGMLCSINELGFDKDVFLPEEAEGIYILPKDTPIGEDIKDILQLNDTIFLFELTPNRADCFSMIGLSREFSVFLGVPYTLPEITVKEDDASIEGKVKVSIEDPELCSRFATRLIDNVTIGPSPMWMQNRLRNVGIRPINNVVDVTNYVMIEMGQPMHAYDYEKIRGAQLCARLAKEGEEITTLDGSKKELDTAMLVIADEQEPLGVAGVMGGAYSEVTGETTTILLEAAAFKGESIRKTARAIGLRTQSSGRFERGVNEDFIPAALERAAQLLQEMDPKVRLYSGMVDVYPEPKEKRSITFTAEEINKHLGTSIEGEQMVDILRSLQFHVEQKGDSYTALVPDWRDDVCYMCDIAEEVARINGYDHIAPELPEGALFSGGKSKLSILTDSIKQYLVEAGLNEAITFSFMHKDSLHNLLYPEGDDHYNAIPILNPISEEFPFMRTTLVPSILSVGAKNLAQKNMAVSVFETGAIYKPIALPLEDFPEEHKMMSAFMCGAVAPAAWPNDHRRVDFYDVKGIVEGLIRDLGYRDYRFERSKAPYLHPGISADCYLGDMVVAHFGQVHPQVAKNFGVPKDSFVIEMYVNILLKVAPEQFAFEAISKYPQVKRDLAILANKDTTSQDIESIMYEHGGEFLKDVYLFDAYEGPNLEEGKKSLAYTLTFGSLDKTLQDKDIDQPISDIVNALESISCMLRDK